MLDCVVNPVSRSGKGLKLWQNVIKPYLIEKNLPFNVHFSKERGDVTRIVWELCSSKKEPFTLVLLGGDGTLNDAVQGITDFEKITIAYIPTGSSNDLARDMKITKNIKKRLKQITSNPVIKKMDIGLVDYGNHTRCFVDACGIGFDAAVCQKSTHSRLKKSLNKIGLGKLTYAIIALNQVLHSPKATAILEYDDGRIITLKNFLFSVAMLHCYEGGGLKFCPAADAFDGILDTCTVNDKSCAGVFTALPFAFKGYHTKIKGISISTCSRVKIKTDIPLWVHTDGEVTQKAQEITVSMIEDKLSFIS